MCQVSKSTGKFKHSELKKLLKNKKSFLSKNYCLLNLNRAQICREGLKIGPVPVSWFTIFFEIFKLNIWNLLTLW